MFDAKFTVHFVHRLRFTTGVFEPRNATLAELLAPHSEKSPVRALFFVDAGLARAAPSLVDQIDAYAAHRRTIFSPAGVTQIIPGGEAIKNEPRALEPVLRAIDEAHLCRQSYIIAVGGGAVLDAVGFAAAMAHRGIRLIRIPSTTLAQADSAMGVKNGINAFGKKNYLGAFSPPWAVVNDGVLLQTLRHDDWISGFSEAVKVALLKDPDLFAQIEAHARALVQRDMAAALPVICRSAQLHFEHVTRSGDPFELTEARPLDFGHWAAHKLESLTQYALPHGHAVAIGMALDLTYAKLVGYLSDAEHDRILTCLTDLSFELFHPAMRDVAKLLTGLDEFREHLGGALTIPIIRAIGEPCDLHEIDRPTMLRALEQLARFAAVQAKALTT